MPPCNCQCVCVCVCLCACVCVYSNTQMHKTHMHTQTDTWTHMDTHMHSLLWQTLSISHVTVLATKKSQPRSIKVCTPARTHTRPHTCANMHECKHTYCNRHAHPHTDIQTPTHTNNAHILKYPPTHTQMQINMHSCTHKRKTSMRTKSHMHKFTPIRKYANTSAPVTWQTLSILHL